MTPLRGIHLNSSEVYTQLKLVGIERKCPDAGSQAGSLRYEVRREMRYLSSFAETTTTRPLSPMVVLPTTTFSPCRKPTGDRKPTF